MKILFAGAFNDKFEYESGGVVYEYQKANRGRQCGDVHHERYGARELGERRREAECQHGAHGTGGKGESRVSRVELIQKGIDFDRVPANAIDDWYQFGKQPEGIPVFIVDTDETGHYEIKDVPAGEYYMVVVAPRIGDGMADLTRTNAGYNLSKYLPNWESFAMFTGGMQSCVVREVTVSDDKDVTLDHDFSGNPFAEK